MPFGSHDLVRWSQWSPHLIQGLQWLKRQAWPWLSLVMVLVMRQEAHRWFDVRRGRRSADRLMTTWFTFVGTLLVVDWLSPVIQVHWPLSAIEATVWLVTLRVISWISCLLHPASRRKFKKFLRRWPIVHWLDVIIE